MIVYEDLDLPSGGTPYPAEVRIRLAGAQGRPIAGRRVATNTRIVGETILTQPNGGINAGGVWSFDFAPNTDIDPPGTTWYVERNVPLVCDPYISFLSVPATGGPWEAFLLEDDPLGEITQSALAAHAARVDLHGGGIEVAFAARDSNVVVTGTSGGLFVAAVPLLTVTVPDLNRPVYLHGHIPGLQAAANAPAEGSFGIYPQGQLGIFAALDGVPVPDMDTTTHRTVDPWARLPAHRPGDYVIGGTGAGGNLTIKVAATALRLAWVRALTA